MKNRSFPYNALAGIIVCSVLVFSAGVSYAGDANHDYDQDHDHDSRIEIGFRAAPVPLNLRGKNRAQVGYGSYLVNVAADCNGCHTSDPAAEYLPNANPFFGSKSPVVNPATYLAGGQDFGALIPGSAHIVSRNLTPDRSGLPAGGTTLRKFLDIMRNGTDYDNLHPTCGGAPNANCIPMPFDGSLLQIMPWPTFRRMTEDDLKAIYAYLTAVPCNAGPPAPSVLHNNCR